VNAGRARVPPAKRSRSPCRGPPFRPRPGEVGHHERPDEGEDERRIPRRRQAFGLENHASECRDQNHGDDGDLEHVRAMTYALPAHESGPNPGR
jgi:hypothetical protein